MKVYYNLNSIYRIFIGLLFPKVDFLAEVDSYAIVWPWQTEMWRSLQASEVTMMTDAIRWEVAGRLGYLKALFKKKGWAVVGSQKIIYKKPIKIFSRVRVSTQFLGWEDNWIYVSHKYRVRGELCAVCFVRISMKNARGKIRVEDIGEIRKSPEIPKDIKNLFVNDSVLLKKMGR